MLYAKLNMLTVKRALQFHKNVRNDGIETMLSCGGGPMSVTGVFVFSVLLAIFICHLVIIIIIYWFPFIVKVI